jgi:hypothetical protein
MSTESGVCETRKYERCMMKAAGQRVFEKLSFIEGAHRSASTIFLTPDGRLKDIFKDLDKCAND